MTFTARSSDEARPQPAPRLAEALLATGLCLGSLLAVATFLDWAAPQPYVECISDKLALLEQGRGRVDTIFIGSSRTHHDYAPAVFDATMASHGLATRSLNLGAPGMRLLETLYLLREMARRGVRLEHVFVELDEFFTPALSPNRGKPREVYWHDLAHTVLAIRSVHRASLEERGRRRGPARLLEDLGHDLQHLRAWGQGLLNVGLVAQLVGPPEETPDVAASCIGPAADGFVPLAGKPGDAERQEAMRRSLEGRLEQFAADRSRTAPAAVSDFEVEVLEAIVVAAERMGAETAFVMSPLPADRRGTLQAVRQWGLGRLYAFNDPQRYPHLLSAKLMYDSTHLNEAGAEAFTRRLAEEVAADLLDVEGPPGAPSPDGAVPAAGEAEAAAAPVIPTVAEAAAAGDRKAAAASTAAPAEGARP